MRNLLKIGFFCSNILSAFVVRNKQYCYTDKNKTLIITKAKMKFDERKLTLYGKIGVGGQGYVYDAEYDGEKCVMKTSHLNDDGRIRREYKFLKHFNYQSDAFGIPKIGPR